MKVAVVSVFPEALRALMAAGRRFDASHPGWGSLHLFNAGLPPRADDLQRLTAALASADAVIVDLMGADPRWQDAVTSGVANHQGALIAIGMALSDRARLGSFELAHSAIAMPASRPAPAPRPAGIPGAMPTRMPATTPDASADDAASYAQLVRAFHCSVGPDAEFILGTLLRIQDGRHDIDVPDPSTGSEGVFPADPATRTRYPDAASFLAARDAPAGRPVVALLYYGRAYPNDTESVAAGLASALSEVCWVLPVAVSMDAAASIEPLRELFAHPGLRPDLVINLMGFRFGAGPRGGDASTGEQLLNELGAPYLKPLVLAKRTEQQWRESPAGLGPSEVLVSIMLPELDGSLGQLPIAALAPPQVDPDFGLATAQLGLIPAQLERFVERVTGLLDLQRTANPDKRVAIIGYDYPAGESNLLGGSFLDVAASLEAILARLRDWGYRVNPPAPGQLLGDLLAKAVNSPSYLSQGEPPRYPQAAARADLGDALAWQTVDRAWPADVGLPMIDPQGDFLIPAVEYGNVLVGVQPGRGPLTDDAAAHDNTVPPHPQYLAYYTWLRKVWGADVIVHVGTHGTFEFLQAKENAVSADCFPDLMLGGVPHVYLYYTGNPSEALIARRRSHACLVSYQPPVMRPGGLHDELAGLATLLGEYRRSLDMAPQLSADLLAELQEQAAAAHLPTDPAELETELERMGTGLVPLGLHVFGAAWDAAEVTAMVQAVLANGLDDLPAAGELIARSRGVQTPIDDLPAEQRASYLAAADELVELALAEQDLPPDNLVDAPELAALVQRARDLAARFGANEEWAGLQRALAGGHLAARLGGDLTRTPDVLPSGASIYQFDPRQVPTPLAARRGAEIAAAVSAEYRRTHDGADPTTVGVVLWGLETSRTQGESYAQIMALLGVRPATSRRPGAPRWELIPAGELDAPRGDVVVPICGFFRDLFGTLIEELDDIFAAVAALDEPEQINPIAARVRASRAALLAAGRDLIEAGELASARVFGPAPGVYGTGLTDIIEAGQWQTTDQLADAFELATQHVYGRRRHGAKAPEIYRERLASIEVVSQTRSSNEYQITDLDHYFEYLGGLTASVQSARGAPVPTLVTDTTARRVFTSSAADATRRGLYTRLLNPEWIEAMLGHGHRGVREVADRTMNLVGLSATTGQIDGWVFDAVHQKFIADQAMLERLTAANPHATADLAARLTEADRRGLWQPTPTQRQQLADVQFDIDSELEGAGSPSAPDNHQET